MSVTEPPVPLALLIADEVYRDHHTGKWIIAGDFSAIISDSFPVRQDKLVVFLKVTQVVQETPLRLRIESAEDGATLIEVPGTAKAGSPLQTAARSLCLRGLTFHRPGKYWVQLMCDEEILIQAPLYLIRKGEQQQESSE